MSGSKNRFKVDYPTDSEVNSAVKAIVQKGIVKRKPFCFYLLDMCRNVGLRHIFRDGTEIAYTLLFFAAVFIALCTGRSGHFDMIGENMYALVFVASPLLFFVVSVIAFINARCNDTFEVEMSCKYNIYQLAAFRMFMFSIMCTLFDAACAVMLVVMCRKFSLVYLLALSVAGLFIFSMLFLFVLCRARSHNSKYFAAGFWVLANLLPFAFQNRAYGVFLASVPLYVYWIVAAVCAAVYIDNLKSLVVPKEMEM